MLTILLIELHDNYFDTGGTYGKYFRLIVSIVLPIGIVIGLILCGISNSEYHKLDYLLIFNVPGWLLSPLWIGALIYSLSRLELGQEITYKNAIKHGGVFPIKQTVHS